MDIREYLLAEQRKVKYSSLRVLGNPGTCGLGWYSRHRMWLSKDRNQLRDQVFKELIQELRQPGRTHRISQGLKHKLEVFTKGERCEIVNRVREGYTPLFLAARYGMTDVVRYLVERCGADFEKKGVYEVLYEPAVHYVTPLWCAAVVGHLEVCKVLVEYGANVNATSDTGSTAVRSACYMTNTEIVKFLVENGADVNKPNDNGGTCLINAVQSADLCEFLLKNGAHIDAFDSQEKTALHYAAQEDRRETTILLLKYGADHLLKSKHGDDVLTSACLLNYYNIVNILINSRDYPTERIADAYELLGATALDDRRHAEEAFSYWRTAIRLRQEHGIIKETQEPKAVFLHRTPFKTNEELDALEFQPDELRIQCLLINERVLGPYHKETLYRMMHRGAAYADSMNHQRCIDVWTYATVIRLENDIILHSDTCVNILSLTKILFDMHDKYERRIITDPLRLSDVIFLIELFLEHIPIAMKHLEIAPVHREHQKTWDKLLRILVFVVHLADRIAATQQEKTAVIKLIRRLVLLKPESTDGNTLLHIVVGQVDSLRRTYNLEELDSIFPDPNFARLLIEAGAFIDKTNQNGSTPLHTASLRVNYKQEIVQMLLEAGAHVDTTNNQGNQPYRMLGGNPKCKISLTKHITLKCLAATKVKSYKIEYKGIIPKRLEYFVEMH